MVLGAFRSSAGAVRRTPHRRSRRDLESVPTTPQWFCGILRTIVGGQTWFSAPTDRARASSGERRTDGADVTMRWDLRRRNWFCGMPRSFRTTQTCLSEHLDHPPMPTGGGSRRSGRGDVVIVGTCFSHISSLHRGSDKFVSTRRPPGVARASTVAREVLIWRRCDKFIVYSALQECVMIV